MTTKRRMPEKETSGAGDTASDKLAAPPTRDGMVGDITAPNSNVPVPTDKALVAPPPSQQQPKAEMVPYNPETSSCRDAIPKTVTIAVAHIFQDVSDEHERYGKHPKGTWVDSQTQEVIVEAGKTREFVLVNRTPRMILTVWPEEQTSLPPIFTAELDMDSPPLGPVNRIPREYLTPPEPAKNDPGGRVASWNDDARQLRIRLNWVFVALFAPDFDEPLLLAFTWTSQKTGKTLENKERTRSAAGKLGAIWRLGSRIRRNPKNQEWHGPTIGLVGDAKDEALEAAKTFFNGLRTLPVNLDWGAGDGAPQE